MLRRRRLGTLFTRTLFGSHPDPDLVEFAHRDRLDRVTLPTLVLSGSKASLQRFAGAGHLMVLERAHQIAGPSPS